MLGELAIVFILILASGVLAGAEIAIVSVRKTRLQALLEEGRPSARALGALRGDPDRFFATVQIGITVIATTASAFGGSSVAAHIEPTLRAMPRVGHYAHDLALGAVVVANSFLSLVFGELVPKSLALRAAERYALFVARGL